jgi:hypothetical protein
MISDRGMEALRAGAALVHMSAQVRVRVCHGHEPLVDVGDGPSGSPALHLSPCEFRAAVLHAQERRRAGHQLRFLSLPADAEPLIDLRVPVGDAVLPGGIVRVTAGRLWLHLLAIPRPIDECLAAVGGAGLHGLGFHGDPPLEATVLHMCSPAGDDEASRLRVDTLEQAAAACAVAAFEQLLQQAAGRDADAA